MTRENVSPSGFPRSPRFLQALGLFLTADGGDLMQLQCLHSSVQFEWLPDLSPGIPGEVKTAWLGCA